MRIKLQFGLAIIAFMALLVPNAAQAALTVGSTSVTSDAALTMNAVANTADAIYLHANGGTSETIKLHADQGTGVDSINLLSDAGGITLQSSLASADAININATVGGLDLDALTGLAINVSSATVASNITIAVNADAEDFTISTTGSAGDIFITSADDLTLTGSPVAIVSTGSINVTGSIAVTGNISFVNGAIRYNDSGGFTDCSTDGVETVDLSTGNYFPILGSGTQDCTISFSNASIGGLYIVNWNWIGAHDFIINTTGGQTRTIKQVCEADGSTLDDPGDTATTLIYMTSSSLANIISCAVNSEV